MGFDPHGHLRPAPAGPGRVGRLPQAGRAAVPGRVRRPVRQHPQRAAAGLPRYPRAGRRAGLRGQGGRRDPALRRQRGGHRADHRPGRRTRPRRRHRRLPHRADQDGRAGSARVVRGPYGAGRLDRQRKKGHHSVSSSDLRPIKRALISVYDKSGLDELVKALTAAGVEIVSTGSTAARIEAAGRRVTRVEELTGFPECLDGRVKTLHPKVHAGLLADLRLDTHAAELEELGVEPFDLLVSNLYPFRETVASGAGVDECVEQIDIGGPAMVRAAAKNHASVAVATTPVAYPLVVEALGAGGFTLAQRRRLAARAFADIAEYDVAVAEWTAQALARNDDWWPDFAGQALRRSAVLRYGENPHQAAALYSDPDAPAGLAQAEQLHGKEMSYNNYVDADAAWRSAHDFAEPCVAIIKHANPCGIAVGVDVADAHRKAHACDPVSAFGGVIATNVAVSVAMAEQVAEIFTEVIAAPDYDEGAVEILARKPSIRILRTQPRATATELRQIS